MLLGTLGAAVIISCVVCVMVLTNQPTDNSTDHLLRAVEAGLNMNSYVNQTKKDSDLLFGAKCKGGSKINPVDYTRTTSECLQGCQALNMMAKIHSFHITNNLQNLRLATGVKVEPEPTSDIFKYIEVTFGNYLLTGGFGTGFKGRFEGMDSLVSVYGYDVGVTNTVSESDWQAILEDQIQVAEAIRNTNLNGKSDICGKLVEETLITHTQLVEKYGCDTANFTHKYFHVLKAAHTQISRSPFIRDHAQPHQLLGAAIQMALGLKCVHEAGYVHGSIKSSSFLTLISNRNIWLKSFTPATTNSTNLTAARGKDIGDLVTLFSTLSLAKNLNAPNDIDDLLNQLATKLWDSLVDTQAPNTSSSSSGLKSAIKNFQKRYQSLDMDQVQEDLIKSITLHEDAPSPMNFLEKLSSGGI